MLHWATHPYGLHRSPGKLQRQFLEFTWSLHGVYVDPSLGTDTYSYILLIYSSYTPAGLLMDSIRMHTFPGLLIHSCQYLSRSPERAPQKFINYSANLNLIYNIIKKQISLQRFEPYLLSKLCLTTQPQVLWSPSKIETHGSSAAAMSHKQTKNDLHSNDIHQCH